MAVPSNGAWKVPLPASSQATAVYEEALKAKVSVEKTHKIRQRQLDREAQKLQEQVRKRREAQQALREHVNQRNPIVAQQEEEASWV